MSKKPLPSSFYRRDTVEVATELIGCTLRRTVDGETLTGIIVETEAYLGANDPASHARRGLRSERNESMYLAGGHAYVYFTYGMYHCVNVVVGEPDVAEAILIRALEPREGLDRMRRNRPAAKKDRDLCNGPGKLCMAMEIDRALDGVRLDGKSLAVLPRKEEISPERIGVSPRIGIDGSGEAAAWPLRFFLEGSPCLSRRG